MVCEWYLYIRKVYRRIRTEQDQSVESSHHGQNPASPRPTRGGITRGIETLRLEKQQTEVIGIPEDEVGITETPISPTATYAGNLVPEPGNKRPRATQQKGGRGGSSNTGVSIFCSCVLQSIYTPVLRSSQS